MAQHDSDLNGEDAIKQVLIDLDIGFTAANIFRSFQPHTDTTTLPYLAIKSIGGSPIAPRTATERLSFIIELYSSGIYNADANPTPEASHRALWRAVLGGLYVTDLATLLSAAVSDFTVHPDDIDYNRGPNNIVGTRFVSQMNLTMTISPSDIS